MRPKFERKEKKEKKRFMDRKHGAAHSCLLIDNLFSATFEKNVSKKRIEVWEEKKRMITCSHTRDVGKGKIWWKKKRKRKKIRKNESQLDSGVLTIAVTQILGLNRIIPFSLGWPILTVTWDFNYFIFSYFQFFNRKLVENILLENEANRYSSFWIR